MLDVLNTPQPTNKNVQTFYATAANNGVGWQTWVKPRGIDFVQFFVLAGGGGGGGGIVGAVSAAAGGGGGGSSAQASPIFPAWQLPDILYVSVGYGGARGTAGTTAPAVAATAGGTGVNTYITLYPNITFVNQIICQVNGGTGGGAASGATAGALGAAGTVSLITAAPLAGLGFTNQGIVTAATQISIAGQSGTAGGSAAIGANIALPVTGLTVTGGTGGAGIGNNASTGFAGGRITAVTPVGVFPEQLGGSAAGTTTASGGNGSNGYLAIPNLNFYYGGTGGGASGGQGGSGGNGGAGAYGCGGGGGGGAFTGGLAGSNGGKGGDGIIIATAW